MFRNYIIRNDIYPDEIEDNNTFRQQKCVILEKETKIGPIYELIKVGRGNRYYYEEGDMIAESTIKRDLYYFIAYVDSDEKALEIASRFVKEEAQNNTIYKIKWVDQHYSIFD
jgi:hypothetical protein